MLLRREYCVPRNIPGAGVRIKNDFSQQEKDTIFRNNTRRNNETTQRASEVCEQRVTSSLDNLIGHGQGTTKVHQTARPQNQIETGWKSAWEGAHRSLSVRQKLRNLRNCSRRRRKGHNLKEACSSLTIIADARVTKKKVYRVKSRREKLMQRIKDRRRNILQHL